MPEIRRRKPAYCSCDSCRAAQRMSFMILSSATGAMMIAALLLSLIFA